ncbi:MAG: hypothetical protein A2Y25_08740 [Candidatus Melainabacteria bacterium GWF2_37_15]|nr:MAG: hypothetical protein A2Y25_08740 [Candidatus Melainabacteria bacterium GWF2_37_15]
MCKTYFKQRNCLKAFTIAELLIVIGILGVIAALTIPSLIQSYDQKQLNTRWKKEFNVATNAVKKICVNKDFIDFTDETTMRNDFKTVMTFFTEGTWASQSGLTYDFYGGAAGTNTAGWGETSALMMDGSLWRFNVISPTCTGTVGTLNNIICAELTIDVNNTKEPNEYGKDLYFLHIIKVNSDYAVYPYGSLNDGQSCATDSGAEATSRGCSAFFLIYGPEVTPP